MLAGAGSGKTRVITHRIAWLVLDAGVPPGGIVAVTFTNKAASEMRERVEQILGTEPGNPWIGTFHGLCLRMLRRDGERVGLAPQLRDLRPGRPGRAGARLLRDEGADDTAAPRAPSSARISRAKNAMEIPERARGAGVRAGRQAPRADLRALRRGLEARQRGGLRRHPAPGALDLLDADKNPDVRERYAERCLHLLVDEYQDTNRPQYLLIKALTSGAPQRVRRRRRGPIDLQVPRRRDPEHPRLRARPSRAPAS